MKTFKKTLSVFTSVFLIVQLVTAGNTIIVNADSQIPAGAKRFNGNTYYVFNKTMSWSDANDYCNNIGGHLVTITSQKEQDFIDNNLNRSGSRLWIGGYRLNGNSNVWKWVTGEKWNYTNWDDGEPNDSSNVISNENRASVWPHKWNDLNDESSEQSGFICEWETKPAKVSNVKISKIKKHSCLLKVFADKKDNSYKIKISREPNFSKNKTVIIKSKTDTVKLDDNSLMNGLKAKTQYYVRVCAYKTVGKKQVCGKWSKIYTFSTK